MTTQVFNSTAIHDGLRKKMLPVFTGKLLPMLFLTIVMVLYSRKLSYSDYGQFQTVWLYCNILSVVISFGLSSVILSTGFIYFTTFIKANRRTVLILYGSGIAICFGVFYFTANLLSHHTKLLLIAFIFLQCICTVADTLLIKKNKFSFYLSLNFIYSVLFFAIHLYFYNTVFILNQLVFCITCLSVLKAASIFFIPSNNSEKTITGHVPANFASNWVFIGLNEIAGIVASWLDKIFLLYLLPPDKFAIFFNGAFEVPLFGILISTIESIMLTGISANILNRPAAQNIFKESFKVLSFIALPFFFFFLTFHAEGFAVIFNNKYNASIPVFLVSIFIIPVRITHYGVILQCYGQSKKIALGTVMDIGLSLLLMFILYPLLGMPGVALAIVVSTWLQAGYYVWQTAKLMQVKVDALVPYFFLLKFSGALAIFYSILYFIKQYFSSTVSLAGSLIITATIICSGLIIYFKKK